MKSLPINNESPENVNPLSREADRILQDPETILALVDLIFGFQEDTLPPS